MYECIVSPDSSEASFNGQLFQLPAHYYILDVYVEGTTLHMLAAPRSTDTPIVYGISICAVDEEWFTVSSSNGLKSYEGSFPREDGIVTLGREFFRTEVARDGSPFL